MKKILSLHCVSFQNDKYVSADSLTPHPSVICHLPLKGKAKNAPYIL